jgi:hypothetical protein
VPDLWCGSGVTMVRRQTVSRKCSVFAKLTVVYSLVLALTGVSLLYSAQTTASSAATGNSALAVTIDPVDFHPQRHCTASTIPADAQSFSVGDLVATVNNLPSNSTLVIQPAPNNGEYVVSLEMAIRGKQNVTICGAPGTRPRIKQTSNAWRIFTVADSSNITIEGLEIYSIYDANHDQVSGVQAIEGAHHVNIWDMWVHDVPACGICSARSQGHNDFRYNRVWRTAAYSRYNQSGISIFSNRIGGGADDTHGYSDYLVGNMVWASQVLLGRATDGNCIIIDNNNGDSKTPAFTGHTLIVNNLCVANGGRGIHMLKSNNVDVVNNTLYHDLRGASARGTGLDGHQGEISVPYSSNLRIVNNLSVAIPYGNVFDSAAIGQNVQLAGNMFNGPTSRQPSGGFTMIGSPLLSNPQDDPSTGDFHPKAGSPVINAGTPSFGNVVIPTVDFNGDSRNTASPSVGAFEP